MCLAVPGLIESILVEDPIMRTGLMNFGGIKKEINLAYVPDGKVGDYVIVHVGFAINILDESEANRVFDYLEEMGELEDLSD